MKFKMKVHLVVHFVFFSKSDHKILNDGYFEILAIECTGEVQVLIQNFMFPRFIYQLLLKLAF